MSIRRRLALSAAVLALPYTAHAKAECPEAVQSSAKKAHPGAKLISCKEEKAHGKVQYDVKLENKDAKRLELDVAPEGSILQTEEKVPVKDVPKAVLSALEEKYPKAQVSHAEKQTHADGAITFELAFKDAKGRHEVTFAKDGSAVEEP